MHLKVRKSPSHEIYMETIKTKVSQRSWYRSCQTFWGSRFTVSEMSATFQVYIQRWSKAAFMSNLMAAAAEYGGVKPSVIESVAQSGLTYGTWTKGIYLNYIDYLRDVESVRPAHFPEPLELGSCGEHNALNYGVWTSHVGPGRQELTSPHLLHASDPRPGWEAFGASGAACGSPRHTLPGVMAKGKPGRAEPRRPCLLTSARARWAPLRAHRARCPLPPAHGEVEDGSKIPQ